MRALGPARVNLRAFALAAVAAAGLAHDDIRAETLSIRLDRNPIRDDETAHLIVETDTQADGQQPDIAPLHRDFEILERSTSTHVASDNGTRSARTEWRIELAPRRPGHFTIGPLRVGSMTSPAIELEVVPSSSNAARAARDVFLEVEATPREVYVQSQLVCVLRIYRAAEFLDATLSDFSPDRAVTHRLGKDSTDARIIDGRRYRVIERRFAVFPQESGPFILPAFRLDARVAEPGAASTMGRLFGEGRRVRIATQPIGVMVKPRPDTATIPWLPAKAVTLSDEWPEEPIRLVVGEPVTWTLRLGATGLTGEQLPPIEPVDFDDARVYLDQPSVVTRTSAQAVHGERVQRIAMVPGAAGTLTIPELRVEWWDVEADAPRTALIPARTMSVAPAPASTTAPRPALAEPPAVPETSSWLWQGVSAALALAWLVTLGVLVHVLGWRRGADPGSGAPADAPPRHMVAVRRRVLSACHAADPRAARDALLDWAGLAWPESRPRDLVALAARVREERFAEAIIALDRALWSARDADWTGQSLAMLLPRELEPAASIRSQTTAHRLPSLHPA